jgi:ABC-2 type transport system permease protein
MTLLAQTWYVTLRHLRGFMRQPWYILGTLIQPVIWLLLFGKLFRSVVEIPGFATQSYITFLTPGVVVMVALYADGWSGMSVIEDLDRGVVDRFLVSPIHRGALLGGLVAYEAVLTVLQSAIIVGLGLLMGARFSGGVAGVAMLIAAAVLLGAAWASLSNALALMLRTREAVIGAFTVVVMPLSFLSAAFMQLSLVPGWMRGIARFNPVNWAVEAGREALGPSVDWGSVLAHTGSLALVAAVCAWLSVRAIRSYQRTA